MRYLSTRAQAPELAFDEVLLTGLARDGGLYVPAAWPRFGSQTWRALRGQRYQVLAERMLTPFMQGSALMDWLPQLIDSAYESFAHETVAPLVQIGPNLWLLELFHGPTLAFKDVAMQLLGQLFDALLTARGERLTIVGATSGDTGSAAIEALRGLESVQVFILHPKDRTSEVQRRQMTSVMDANIHNLAVEGTFDDCQDIVKALFADADFRDRVRLSAVNSINWARILAQSVYYAYAALALGAPERPLRFVVPTGNFGNVFAGYVAARMGLPVERFVVAANSNDILARTILRGDMSMDAVVPTLSPSMDIQVSSNFERMLFELSGRDGAFVRDLLQRFRKEGRAALPDPILRPLRGTFASGSLDDNETLAEMRLVHGESGEVIDPHTAVGTGVARNLDVGDGIANVVLATAHPAKFPDAVERAIGRRPALPERLRDLYDRPERMSVVPNDAARVMATIEENRGN